MLTLSVDMRTLSLLPTQGPRIACLPSRLQHQCAPASAVVATAASLSMTMHSIGHHNGNSYSSVPHCIVSSELRLCIMIVMQSALLTVHASALAANERKQHCSSNWGQQCCAVGSSCTSGSITPVSAFTLQRASDDNSLCTGERLFRTLQLAYFAV
jgi:hypothetical protein